MTADTEVSTPTVVPLKKSKSLLHKRNPWHKMVKMVKSKSTSQMSWTSYLLKGSSKLLIAEKTAPSTPSSPEDDKSIATDVGAQESAPTADTFDLSVSTIGSAGEEAEKT